MPPWNGNIFELELDHNLKTNFNYLHYRNYSFRYHSRYVPVSQPQIHPLMQLWTANMSPEWVAAYAKV
jgi:hypothetical protein